MSQINMQSPKPLDREAFLARVVTKPVTLSDGAVVNIRAIPASFFVVGSEQDEAAAKEHFGAANLLVQALVDENGQRMFADGETDQVMVIDNVSLHVLLEEILKFSGMAQPAPGEVGDIEKN